MAFGATVGGRGAGCADGAPAPPPSLAGHSRDPAVAQETQPVVSTKVVCDGPGDQRAEDVKAATA